MVVSLLKGPETLDVADIGGQRIYGAHGTSTHAIAEVPVDNI